MRDAIALTNVETFYGPIRFNEKGQNIAKTHMGVIQVQNGHPVDVYPTETAAAPFIYPLPH
jgi:branched-chain amino acid transport system substrate-binding protein